MHSSELEKIIRTNFLASQRSLKRILDDQEINQNILQVVNILLEVINKKCSIYACGNGGSMCDAMHFCEELTGKFRKNRISLPAISISDPAYITCVGNDYGFEYIFSRFLEGNAKENDFLLVISTSGKSKNIINAAKFAKENRIKVVSLTGVKNSELSHISDIDICTPVGDTSDRIQEMHITIIHIIVELIERVLFPCNYKS